MRPPSLPTTLGSTPARVGLTIGSGGAGSLAALAFVHNPTATTLAAAAVTAALAANAAESACAGLPGIITAISNLLTLRIRAKADAKATLIFAAARADLARSGLDPGSSAHAADMLRFLCLNPDLPENRRPADETFLKLQAATRTRSTSSESGTGPDSPGNGSRRSTATNKVLAFRADT
jgi:hypothetical protein